MSVYNHPDELSLAIPPWVGGCNQYQRQLVNTETRSELRNLYALAQIRGFAVYKLVSG